MPFIYSFLVGSAPLKIFGVIPYLAWTGALLAYFLSDKKKWFRGLSVGMITFFVGYAVVSTVTQYVVWKENGFTKFFLPPYQSTDYILIYAWVRIWLRPIIGIACALLFFAFLKSLEKYRDRFFDEGDIELGFLASLIVGWPGFVIFLPVVFVSVVLVSLFRGLVWRETYTTLGIPFLLGSFVVLMWSAFIIESLHLGVLKI